MRYELAVGLRYTRARRRNRFISFISLSSMAGIALGVAALIVVLSVMNGFQQELRARILAVVSHVQITGVGERLADWRAAAEVASKDPRVLATAPYVNAQGMLSYGRVVRGTLIRGVLPAEESKVADLARSMKAGSLDSLAPGAFNIVLGSELARALGVLPGERVVLVSPQGLVTPAGVVPRMKTFVVTGIFEVGMFEYDSSLALVHLEDAQKLFQTGTDVSGLRLRVDDIFAARAVARSVMAGLGPDALASDWTRSHANFFRAVEIEKRVMFIILALIIAVAAFNIVSTLVMLVTDKQADIAILRTLGASPSSIMGIFMVQGTVIGVIGTAIGVLLGLWIGLNVETVVPAIENTLGFKFLAKDVYYISDLPSDVQAADVLTIAVVSLVLSFLATLYPSWRAAKVNPAEALRYE